jgi:30S ribosomal protein S31
MGKGDRKTAKGKRFNSSYGKARPKSAATTAGAGGARPVVKKAATRTTRTVAKAPAKKVAKKTVAKG